MLTGRRPARALAALCAVLAAVPLQAQRVQADTPFLLDGRVAGCGPYPIYLDDTLSGVGMAWADQRGAWITLNPALLDPLPTELKLFIFAHECGHLVTRGTESDADCWAIRTGRDQGWFGEENFDYLVADLADSPGDFTHAPGPQRLRHIQACFQAP